MHRSSAVGPAEGVSHHELNRLPRHQEPETVNHVAERTVAADEPAESVAVAAPVRPAERSDGAEYERVLAFWKATWKDLARSSRHS